MRVPHHHEPLWEDYSHLSEAKWEQVYELIDNWHIPAAPEMRATIAACTYEYGVQGAGGHMVKLYPGYDWEWTDTEITAWQVANQWNGWRMVRRLVGPVEVVEG
ncbi:hypothetical protein [Corynebacterium sp. AOP12-C2-36]|uniref:hypothetical protein n=1 Tax=Corynebacterium sp. AOP12-C2-36 TaxID=3457723 RepID=UPI004034D12C